jgi:hypothetical protein
MSSARGQTLGAGAQEEGGADAPTGRKGKGKGKARDGGQQQGGGGEDEEDLDALLAQMQLTPGVCSHVGCKASTELLGSTCVHCKLRYCLNHGQPLAHGCELDARASARAGRFKKK